MLQQMFDSILCQQVLVIKLRKTHYTVADIYEK